MAPQRRIFYLIMVKFEFSNLPWEEEDMKKKEEGPHFLISLKKWSAFPLIARQS